MNSIFSDCSSLITLEIPNFFMQQLMENNDVFKNVNKLRYINIENMKYNSEEDYTDNTCINHDCNLPLNFKDKPIFVCQSNKFISNSNIKEICCFFDIENDICRTFNFITLTFNHDCYYENGFKNEFRSDIAFINYNNSSMTVTSELNILAGTQLELYFYNPVITMEKFFSKEEDNNMLYVVKIDLSSFSSDLSETMDSMF